MSPLLRLSVLVLILPLAACLPGSQEGNSRPPLSVEPGETLLLVAAPALDAQAPMKRVGNSGSVDTWMSADRYSISLRDGIVVATRGFGFDLMGSDAEVTLGAIAAPDAGIYSRQMRYLTSDNRSTWLKAGCTMSPAADSSGANRLEEACTTYANAFTNVYWLGASGQILRSRQWVSAEVGYLNIDFTQQ